MMDKRKSMNAGDDHAYKLQTYTVCLRSSSHCEAMFKGVSGDASPDKF